MSQAQRIGIASAIQAIDCGCIFQGSPCQCHSFSIRNNEYIGIQCNCATGVCDSQIRFWDCRFDQPPLAGNHGRHKRLSIYVPHCPCFFQLIACADLSRAELLPQGRGFLLRCGCRLELIPCRASRDDCVQPRPAFTADIGGSGQVRENQVSNDAPRTQWHWHNTFQTGQGTFVAHGTDHPIENLGHDPNLPIVGPQSSQVRSLTQPESYSTNINGGNGNFSIGRTDPTNSTLSQPPLIPSASAQLGVPQAMFNLQRQLLPRGQPAHAGNATNKIGAWLRKPSARRGRWNHSGQPRDGAARVPKNTKATTKTAMAAAAEADSNAADDAARVSKSTKATTKTAKAVAAGAGSSATDRALATIYPAWYEDVRTSRGLPSRVGVAQGRNKSTQAQQIEPVIELTHTDDETDKAPAKGGDQISPLGFSKIEDADFTVQHDIDDLLAQFHSAGGHYSNGENVELQDPSNQAERSHQERVSEMEVAAPSSPRNDRQDLEPHVNLVFDSVAEDVAGTPGDVEDMYNDGRPQGAETAGFRQEYARRDPRSGTEKSFRTQPPSQNSHELPTIHLQTEQLPIDNGEARPRRQVLLSAGSDGPTSAAYNLTPNSTDSEASCTRDPHGLP